MKNYPRWLNEFRKSLKQFQHNPQVHKFKKQVTSLSEQTQQSFNKHYENIPKYRSQLTQKSKELNDSVQQKFHEFSQSNPTIKQYQSKLSESTKNMPKLPNMPNLNVKKTIDSTMKQTQKISSNLQSSAKQFVWKFILS